MGAANATNCADGIPKEYYAGGLCPSGTNGGTTNNGGGGGGGGAGIGVGIAGAQSNAAAQSAALAAGGNAQALGGAGGVGLGGSAAQRQQQQQGQSLTNQNQNSSGVVIQGNQSGSGDTYVDKSRGSVFLPPVLFAPGLPPMAGVGGQPTVTACGPRQAIYREPVYAIMRNTFTPDQRQFAGWDEYAKDVPEGEKRYIIEKVPTGFAPDGSLIETTIVWGEQSIIRIEALSRASGAGFSFGGFVKDVGGQAGASGQVQVQGFVTAISTVACQMPIRPAVVVQTNTVTLPPEVVYKTRTRTVYRDRPVSCCCTAVVAPSCSVGGVK
jgi:hypothetical protein